MRSRQLRWKGIVLSGIFLASLSSGLQAQTMYRCNSSYQDRPCEAGQQAAVIGKMSVSAQKGDVDLACTRRSEEAKKIIWSREGGASQEKLMAEASSGDRRKLIADVYAMRADASMVRAAIEKDCMEEKKQPHVLLDTSEQGPARRSANELKNADTAGNSGANRVQAESNARERAQCFNLKSKMQNIRLAQAEGGSVATMETLNQARRAAQTESTALGCDALLSGAAIR
ncbi:hypothetical protein [Undibacterium sp. Ren11W]|uniref:hypothetical protein n=1 Tax=Undibacterium sp. Ren11W TaxID=3413045 RepID=UPI003BEFC5D8